MEEIEPQTLILFCQLARAVRDAPLADDMRKRAFDAVEALGAEVNQPGSLGTVSCSPSLLKIRTSTRCSSRTCRR